MNVRLAFAFYESLIRLAFPWPPPSPASLSSCGRISTCLHHVASDMGSEMNEPTENSFHIFLCVPILVLVSRIAFKVIVDIQNGFAAHQILAQAQALSST